MWNSMDTLDTRPLDLRSVSVLDALRYDQGTIRFEKILLMVIVVNTTVNYIHIFSNYPIFPIPLLLLLRLPQ